MKYLIWLLRIVLAVTFIFSGLVKANDPLGLAYKMDEFFELWGMGSMVAHSLTFSVIMIAAEIVFGVVMLVGNSFPLFIFLMLLMNIFYTFLTYYALTSGKVTECGCFGDCFKISNTMTFYKDVALTVITLFLWFFRYRVFSLFNKPAINASIVGIAVVIVCVFQWWTLHHLPVYDCLAYKAGNNIWEKMQPSKDATEPVYETILTYQKNGVKKDFTSDNLPWKDPAWKFVDSKTKLLKEGTGQPEIPHDFSLSDSAGNDHTEEIMTAKGYTFLWFVRNPEKAELKNMDVLQTIIDKSKVANAKFYAVCSMGWTTCKTYREVWGFKVPFMTLDGTISKTAMRTDPGLMLLHDGVVVKKWSSLDYPKDIIIDQAVPDKK